MSTSASVAMDELDEYEAAQAQAAAAAAAVQSDEEDNNNNDDAADSDDVPASAIAVPTMAVGKPAAAAAAAAGGWVRPTEGSISEEHIWIQGCPLNEVQVIKPVAVDWSWPTVFGWGSPVFAGDETTVKNITNLCKELDVPDAPETLARASRAYGYEPRSTTFAGGANVKSSDFSPMRSMLTMAYVLGTDLALIGTRVTSKTFKNHVVLVPGVPEERIKGTALGASSAELYFKMLQTEYGIVVPAAKRKDIVNKSSRPEPSGPTRLAVFHPACPALLYNPPRKEYVFAQRYLHNNEWHYARLAQPIFDSNWASPFARDAQLRAEAIANNNRRDMVFWLPQAEAVSKIILRKIPYVPDDVFARWTAPPKAAAEPDAAAAAAAAAAADAEVVAPPPAPPSARPKETAAERKARKAREECAALIEDKKIVGDVRPGERRAAHVEATQIAKKVVRTSKKLAKKQKREQATRALICGAAAKSSKPATEPDEEEEEQLFEANEDDDEDEDEEDDDDDDDEEKSDDAGKEEEEQEEKKAPAAAAPPVKRPTPAPPAPPPAAASKPVKRPAPPPAPFTPPASSAPPAKKSAPKKPSAAAAAAAPAPPAAVPGLTSQITMHTVLRKAAASAQYVNDVTRNPWLKAKTLAEMSKDEIARRTLVETGITLAHFAPELARDTAPAWDELSLFVGATVAERKHMLDALHALRNPPPPADIVTDMDEAELLALI